MASLAVKARTETSVPGSERPPGAGPRRPQPGRVERHRGFTLIELLLVVALIAIVSGLASLALRDPAASRLEQETARLAALLEGARSEARALGLAVTWQPVARDGATTDGGDFRFSGLPAADPLPTHWLAQGVVAEVVGAQALVLGPEPMIGAQRVILRLDEQRMALATDGLGPFVVVAEDEGAAAR